MSMNTASPQVFLPCGQESPRFTEVSGRWSGKSTASAVQQLDQRILSILMAGFHENFGCITRDGFFRDYDFSSLERMGVLEPMPYKTRTNCPWCGHEKPIRTKTGRNGTTEYYCYCQKCGPAKITPDNLRQWKLRRKPFVKIFIESIGIKGDMIEMVPSEIFQLGRRGNVPYWAVLKTHQRVQKHVNISVKH